LKEILYIKTLSFKLTAGYHDSALKFRQCASIFRSAYERDEAQTPELHPPQKKAQATLHHERTGLYRDTYQLNPLTFPRSSPPHFSPSL
jgi:hypothetical protein